MKTIAQIAGIAVAIATVSTASIQANSIAIVPNGGDLIFSARVYGFSFSVSEAINVVSLGFYDSGGDGLGEAHRVALWEGNTSDPLADITVPQGEGAELSSSFRFVSISPLELTPNKTYTIGGLSGMIDEVIRTDFYTLDSAISLDRGRFESLSGGFVRPTSSTGTRLYFGPNFQFTAANAIPDVGSSLILLSIAGTALGFLRCRLH